MSTRNTLITSILLIIAVTSAGLLLWNQFPDQMASHWNVKDQVDGYISRFWGVFLLPVIATAILLLFVTLPQIDPLKKNIETFRQTFNLFILFIVGFMVYIHVLTLVFNLGYIFPMGRAMLPAMGTLLFFVGVLMKRARRNWFIGIRTPWTLSSDTVWDATHRLGAVLFKVCAGLVVVSALMGGTWAFGLTFFPLIGSSLFLILYSYILYRREAAKNS